jgi:formamidopyrimidine-DNA glycosylase
LGPEPWNLSGDEFYERLQRRKKTSIKAAVLDQSVIAGVGNIYADEGLYDAGIFPGRRVDTVSKIEASRILAGIIKVMDKSIESGGSTMKNYVKADGTRGDYLEKFAKVFRREGERCEGCGEVIEKTRVAGRGTHYCPVCQG